MLKQIKTNNLVKIVVDEKKMEGSTRVNNKANNVQPQQDNGSNKVLSVGDRVEAIWSSDGQKYPGRIVHAFPNDSYEVLFDDGVKSRRKNYQIFKLNSSSQPQTTDSPLPPPPPLLPKGRQTRFVGRNNAAHNKTTPVKSSLSRQSSTTSVIPPPPPLRLGIVNSNKNSIELIESLKEDETSSPTDVTLSGSNSSPSTTTNTTSTAPALTTKSSVSSKAKIKHGATGRPPTLIPKPAKPSNANSSPKNESPLKRNKVTSAGDDNASMLLSSINSTTTIDDGVGNEVVLINTNGNASTSSSPLTITTNRNSDESLVNSDAKSLEHIAHSLNSPSSTDSNSSTKKGFVYVQQPHYSVFDPPPVDLGKRQRRVHNYSMLAKGPSLKKGFATNGLEELIDGEFITPTSTPSSSKPNSRSSSPSIFISSSLINNVNCTATSTSPLLPGATPTATGTKGTLFSTKQSVAPHVKVSSLPTPEGGSRFVRKRRFLKSPTKSTDKSPVPKSDSSFDLSNLNPFDDTDTLLIGSSETAATTTSPTTLNCESVAPPPAEAEKTTLTTSATTPNAPSPTTPNIVESSDTTTPPVIKRRRRRNLHLISTPEFLTPLPPSAGDSDGDAVPSKRLRKPSFRFSAEEGYVNVFAQQRRTRRSSPLSTTPLKTKVDETATKEKSPAPQTPTAPSPTSSTTSLSKSHGRKSRKGLGHPEPSPASLLPLPPPIVDAAKSSRSPKKVSQKQDEISEEEELLDIGEYTIPQSSPSPSKQQRVNSKSPTKRPTRHTASPTLSDKIVPSELRVESPLTAETKSTADTSTTETLNNNLVHSPPPRPLRQTSRGRIVRPPPLKSDTAVKEASVVLDRLQAIPKVQILVEKCDSAIPANQSSIGKKLGEKPASINSSSSSFRKLQDNDDDIVVVDIDDGREADIPRSTTSKFARSRKWKNKKRWTKGRGLLPGIRSGMRVSDSHAMHLLKRSRLQRRFDNRGRPKIVLLKGITKKRFKKIIESIKRRKIKRKKISVLTKFKDVRVDIINCVCGRTDEFGLMVQCEVCMCWQHGNCFGYFDDSKLPRFYVCQSCANPKRVRPSYHTEGVRQETYKKGILPTFQFAPKTSLKQQRIFKRCNDLTKMISGIENAIRQNRLKELIATSEPEHKKLYQWSAPRTHPKDLIQKWQFRKYYKAVVRRLIIRHKGKPDYMEKLNNTIAFREKLKKYSQAFDEAKLAISRKIGSRGLILVEKLSEQESKLNKIHKVKDKLDSELSMIPEAMRTSLLSQVMTNQHKSLLTTASGFSLSMTPSTSTPSSESSDPLASAPTTIATPSMIQEFLSQFDGLIDSDDSDDDVLQESVKNAFLSAGEENFVKDKVDDDTIGASSSTTAEQQPENLDDSNKSELDTSLTITNNENADVIEDIIRFNLEQLRDHNIPILEDDDSDNWMEMKRTSISSTSADSDMIKLTLPKTSKKAASTTQSLGTESSLSVLANVDVESESEATLSGDTTVSVEDSEGGEEYWYNPISHLNCEHDAMRKLLLHDPLIEYDKKTDGLWRSRELQTLKRDWIDELDFYLNGDLGLGLDSISDSDSSLSPSDDEDDCPELASDSTDESESDDVPTAVENGKEMAEGTKQKSLRYWQKEVLELGNRSPREEEDDEEEDEEWKADEDYLESDNVMSDPEEVDMSSPTPNSSSTIKRQFSSTLTSETITPPEVSDMMFVTSSDSTDTLAGVGDVIDVRVRVENKPVISKAIILGGIRGENFVKLISTEGVEKDQQSLTMSNFGNMPISQSLLCKSCQESVGVKWNWKQLNSAKGVNIVLEDTVQVLSTEINRCKQLALNTLDAKASLNLGHISDFKPYLRDEMQMTSEHKFLPPFPRSSTSMLYEPRKLTELCRDVLSKPRTRTNRKVTNHLSNKSSNNNTAASAEEESILTLLSLSKAPVDSNGENVSELSIESLRKLTDRLQHNGPLSEDLAKAVTGLPLTNGKIGLQKLDKLSSQVNTLSSPSSSLLPSTTEPICTRCNLQHDNAQKLYILITQNPSLVNCEENKQKLQLWCSRISKAIEDLRLATHAMRSILYFKVQVIAQRKRAEKTARDLGVKITPDSMKKRLQILKPDHYLTKLKAEFVDALMPYATYFISRFTKKDELSAAKKSWIGGMIQNYNNVKKTLKCMYSVENEDGRLQSEDKFYASLDNLRKSFDIVLTKKDIKMRRQNQSFSQSDSTQQGESGGGENQDAPKSEQMEKSAEPELEQVINANNNMDVDADTTTPLVNGLNNDDEITTAILEETTAPEVKIGDDNPENKPSPELSSTTTQDDNGTSSPPPPSSLPEISTTKDEEQTTTNNEEQTTTTNNDLQPVVVEQEPSVDQNNMAEQVDAATARQLQEYEILTRLANYPIQVEDVNALLGIANEVAESAAVSTNNTECPVPPSSVAEQTTDPQQQQQISSNNNTVTEQPMELDDFGTCLENLSSSGGNLVGDLDLINTIGSLGATGGLNNGGTAEESDLLLNVFDDPIFSDPPEEPVPCSSRSITNTKQTQPLPPQSMAPSLAKLTPEMCKGFLLDDIKAHQQVIDSQLDKVDGEIMELERRRGNGLKDKDDHKLFEFLYANMQILLENAEVLKELTNNCAGLDNAKVRPDDMELDDGFDMDAVIRENSMRRDAAYEFSDNISSESEEEKETDNNVYGLKS